MTDTTFGPEIAVNGKRPDWLWDEVLVQRVLSKVQNLNGEGCWVWTGHKNSKGYGRYQFTKGAAVGAHRMVYAIFNGAMPDMDLDHLCRNRACCNPAHLEPVSKRDNTLRGVGLSAINSRKTHCNSGHPFEGNNLKFVTGRGDRPERRCQRCHADRQQQYRSRKVTPAAEAALAWERGK